MKYVSAGCKVRSYTGNVPYQTHTRVSNVTLPQLADKNKLLSGFLTIVHFCVYVCVCECVYTICTKNKLITTRCRLHMSHIWGSLSAPDLAGTCVRNISWTSLLIVQASKQLG